MLNSGFPFEIIEIGDERITLGALLARVFALDATVCPACGGRLRLIAALTEPAPPFLSHVKVSHAYRSPPIPRQFGVAAAKAPPLRGKEPIATLLLEFKERIERAYGYDSLDKPVLR